MKFKHTLVLLIILIVAAAFVFIIERPFENRSEKIRKEAGLLFPELQIEEVKKLLIKKADETTTTLKNRDDVWYVVTDKENYPADPQLINEAIKTLQALKKVNLASRKKDKHALFKVKEKMGMEVILFGSEDKELARLIVGKNGPDFFSTYIRRADADEVFLYERYLKGHYDKPISNWRDKTIFDFDADEVTEIKIAKKEETIIISKDTKKNWHIEKPISLFAENKEVEKILNTFSSLKASDFADEKILKKSGLAEPECKISVTLKDGETKTLFVGNKKEDHYYYAKTEEKDYLYLLYKTSVENLTPSIKDLEKADINPEEGEDKPEEEQEALPLVPPNRR
ncbi:MAG: DUF4340 domain-containing protein [Proteobacteria bacterium]|nr:DUF4340 domain-containing protein [Pseudomonadota bacterium]